MKTIQVSTGKKVDMIDITGDIRKIVSQSGVNEGICVVYVPHTTAGITINEGADPDVRTDIMMALKSFNFEKLPFRHSEGNSPSHSKASIIGASETIIIEGGKLALGTWQSIFFCEYDGPRSRKVYIKIVS
ncbi:MAG: secondary thiamine-phosphate synthase enzyme YjbQ [Spirochaetota bacterium]